MNAKTRTKRRRFKVGVRKEYYPRDRWPKGIAQSYVEVVEVLATGRTEAANLAWQKHGHRWLMEMAPSATKRRIVSLDVNEPAVGTGGTLGRLRSITVYKSA